MVSPAVLLRELRLLEEHGAAPSVEQVVDLQRGRSAGHGGDGGGEQVS